MSKTTVIKPNDGDSWKQPEVNMLLVKMLENNFDNNAKEQRIKSITRYLKSPQNFRTLGLASLLDFLDLYSAAATTFICEKDCQELEWIDIVLKLIDQKSESPDMCFKILTKLLKITAQNPDIHKIIQSKYVRKILDCIRSYHSISSLQCLAVLMTEHSGPSGVFKNDIYDFCIRFIDEMNFELNRHAGICLHLIQQTRGGNVSGITHQKNWAEFHEKLLNTLDELFVILLNTGESIETGKSERLKLPEIVSNKNAPLMYTHQERFIRFKNISIILETGLIESFPAQKSILLNRLISFIEKRITYNQGQLNKKDGHSHLPYVLHIEIQKCLLSLLESLIKSVDANIILHSKDICDILWKCLKSTNIAYDEFKISGNLSLRKIIYNVLIEFMKISPNNHFIYKQMENFMKEAFLDITPLQKEVVLTLPNGKQKKNKRNEIKKALARNVIDNCLKVHQMICEKSLDFLTNLLIFNGAIMKPVLYKILQDKIFATSFKILSNKLSENDLYHSNACRINILNLSYNILIHSASRNVTPMSFGMEIIKKFKDHDFDNEIRQRSIELVKNLEAVLHNRKDPIHFTSDLRDFRDTWLFNEKTVKSFAQVDNERYQQYEGAYHDKQFDNLVKNGDDINAGDMENSAVIEISNDEEDLSTVEDTSNSKNDDIEIEPTKKRSLASNESESIPTKVAKQSTDDSLKTNDDEDVELLLNDFCPV